MTQRLPLEYREHFSAMKKEPKEIFFRGNLELLKRPKISIVGTRRPSQYTQHMTVDIARKLSQAGVVIVSGAAMGVDAQAHFGAGAENTIAVMGNGLNIYYPATNRELIRGIEKEGLALSMYPDDTLAAYWSFVARNEMVVALGDVLIVSEADRNSGSMRSVEYAKKMGKKIYTISHRTGESEGSMDLVKQGEAAIIYDIDKFVAQYGQVKAVENDPFLAFCLKNPSYEAVFRTYGEKVSQYELDGKIAVVNGQIRLI
ncbi:DNA-processing protein DprA [Sulfurimonas sp. HSL3-7]|uniref:DNA-processing protein DprA n=1 Tax=Sulfonitrofixus jiaomeiensis TaxID=3131938 RepID=UPI0031F86681